MENTPQMSTGGNSSTGGSQAGTNLAIVILVLVIVVVGVKLLMSGTPVGAPTEQDLGVEGSMSAEEIELAEENKNEIVNDQAALVVESLGSVGKGEAMFAVYSSNAVIVRTIEAWNPFKKSWIVIYDGYKSIGAGQTVEVFKASLAALTYDRVRVRVLDTESGGPTEFIKESPVTVTAGATANVKIDL